MTMTSNIRQTEIGVAAWTVSMRAWRQLDGRGDYWLSLYYGSVDVVLCLADSMMISDDRSRYSRCCIAFPYPPRRLPRRIDRTNVSAMDQFKRLHDSERSSNHERSL